MLDTWLYVTYARSFILDLMAFHAPCIWEFLILQLQKTFFKNINLGKGLQVKDRAPVQADLCNPTLGPWQLLKCFHFFWSIGENHKCYIHSFIVEASLTRPYYFVSTWRNKRIINMLWHNWRTSFKNSDDNNKVIMDEERGWKNWSAVISIVRPMSLCQDTI